jgi:hypothetical protein
MPSAPLIRYALDPTGINPDNAVTGEVRDLNTVQVRAVVPKYGPFFTQNFQIWDHGTNRLLVKGVDFVIVELLQEATLRFNKEIAQLVLIINTAVSPQVRMNYQVLGGYYQNNADGLVALYEAVMADNRGVDWPNVLNKPTEYPPALHQHMLSDVIGFEPVVVALERIRNAIVLSDVPAFEALMDWVRGRGLSPEEFDAGTGLDKFITFQTLLHAIQTTSFNSISIDPPLASVSVGKTYQIKLASTNLPNNTALFWTIEHGTTDNTDFSTTAGLVKMVRNRGSFYLSASMSDGELSKKFSVAIRSQSTDGPIIAMLQDVTLKGITVVSDENSDIQILTACCISEPQIKINAKSMFLIGDR